MKQTRLVKMLAAGMACAVALSTVFAQTESTTTTTTGAAGVSTSTSTLTSAGTITAYTPDADYITFRTTTDAAPVRYYYTKKTTILDPEGRTVTWSAVRPDLPATVYYVKEGDRMVVNKVVLSKPEPAAVIEKKQTTTTTTTQP